jgi:acyl-CoA thioester hydrolase
VRRAGAEPPTAEGAEAGRTSAEGPAPEAAGGEVFVTTQKLRFCDTDQLGHVNNAVYSVMCEAGRSEMMQAAGLLASGLGVVIARLELDFVREMNWPGEIRIETAIHRLGRKSIQVHQKIRQDGVEVARATSILAVIDTAKRRAVPLTDDWRATLGRWLVPAF